MRRIIEAVKFEDAQVRKAYRDYLYMREVMGIDVEAGTEDLAEAALCYLRQQGKLDKVGVHAGNRYAVKINVRVGSENEPWLLMFDLAAGSDSLKKSVTNALTGRAYPYAAIRLTGSGDPLEMTKGLVPVDGRASQREIATEAAKNYADFAGRLGIATGLASEIYHPAFATERMDLAAVISAAPAVNMRGEEELDDDLILRLVLDEDTCDDAEYLRRVRRLFGDGEVARMIKAAAADEDGVITCRVGAEYAEMFEQIAGAEGFECAINEEKDADGAETSAGKEIAGEADDIRVFFEIEKAGKWNDSYLADENLSFSEGMRRIAEDLNTCSGRGLAERFDSTIGRGSVLMPYSGINQLTPSQAMAHKIPVTQGETDDCSLAAWGFNPYIAESSPYHGGYLAVVEAISKLVATGASFNEIYLSIQSGAADSEDPKSAGRALAGLLGAFEAEMGLSVPAVFFGEAAHELNGLAAYAFTTAKASELISPDFKEAGHRVVILTPEIEGDPASAYYGLPTPDSLVAIWRKAYELIANGRALAAYAPTMGGAAESVMKMSYGNGIGFEFTDEGFDWSDDSGEANSVFGYSYGSIILEMEDDEHIKTRAVNVSNLGRTTDKHIISKGDKSVSIGDLLMLYEGKLESVFAVNADSGLGEIVDIGYAARSWPTPIFKRQTPKSLIPAVPGSTAEIDLARAVREAGASAEILMLDAGSADDIRRAAQMLADALGRSQMLLLPSGFEGAEAEGGGPAALMAEILRQDDAAEAVREFLDRKDGLVLGIGSGFKALLELGLLPKGELRVNTLGAHQSRIVRVRVASNKSPWLRSNTPGQIYSVPVSTSMGRFTADDELIKRLAINGQIANQYVDNMGKASADIRFNPCGSAMAIESICSDDGRILGRVGQIERSAAGLYSNVPGNYLSNMFENAVRYFK